MLRMKTVICFFVGFNCFFLVEEENTEEVI